MPPANRNNPRRANSSTSDYSVTEFLADFPDDAACLDYLWGTRQSADGEHAYCPKCDCERVFRRYATKQQRQSWTCTACGHHLHPTAGTIFHRSSTSLRLWFHAMYLIDEHSMRDLRQTARARVGPQLQDPWRMFNRICVELMNDEGEPQLRGNVEVDETSWGGKPRKKLKTRKEVSRWVENRTTVLGMIERGGRVRLRVIASRRGEPLSGAVRTHVNPSAFLLTDDWVAYKPLRREYASATINHSAGIYVEGDIYTNTIEGFFGNLKTGMRGTYKHVSDRRLQSYLDEYAWRHNHARQGHRSLFHHLVDEAAQQ